jgi:hypothetical protein
MPQLLDYLPFKALAQGVRASIRKLPFKLDAGSLVPDEVPMKAAEADAAEDPAALDVRVLEILRVAAQLQPGPLRRDALEEVNRLRCRAIELHRRNAAGLKVQIAAVRPNKRPNLRSMGEGANHAAPPDNEGQAAY